MSFVHYCICCLLYTIASAAFCLQSTSLGITSVSLVIKNDMECVNIESSVVLPSKKIEDSCFKNKDGIHDHFCWICHKENTTIYCIICPRSFHSYCISNSIAASHEKEFKSNNNWVCLECQKIMSAEDLDDNPEDLPKLNIDQLCILLQLVIHRLKLSGIEPFLKPVSSKLFPSYEEFIVHPMDLSSIESSVKKKIYGSTYSFLTDIKWIHHNCVAFNGDNHRLTSIAWNLVKQCTSEISEIYNCPNCYLWSCAKVENYFIKPCETLHPIIWAKQKGCPFWPAKAMKITDDKVNVCFFGTHEKDLVPINQCFLYSKEAPLPIKLKKRCYDEAIIEVELHIKYLKEKFDGFDYASLKVPLQAEDINKPKKYNLNLNLFGIQDMKTHVNRNKYNSLDEFSQVFLATQASYDKNSTFKASVISCNTQHQSSKSICSPSLSPLSDMLSKSENALCYGSDSSNKSESGHSNSGNSLSPKNSSMNISSSICKVSHSENKSAYQNFEVPISKFDSNAHSILSLPNSYQIKRNDFRSFNKPFLSMDEKMDLEPVQKLSMSIDCPSIEKMHTPDFEIIDEKLGAVKNLVKDANNSKVTEANMGIEIEELTSADSVNENDKNVMMRFKTPHQDEQKLLKQSENCNDCLILTSEKSNHNTDHVSTKPFIYDENQVILDAPQPKRLKLSKGTSDDYCLNKTNYEEEGKKFSDSSSPLLQVKESLKSISPTDVNKYTQKIMDFMKGTMEEMSKELGGASASYQNDAIKALNMEMNLLNVKHQQEIAEISHNSRLVLMEMRTSLELDKKKSLAFMQEVSEKHLLDTVQKTKKKQWCANCGKEAMFYCCWNTSYCDFHCQHNHWFKHMSHCTQANTFPNELRISEHSGKGMENTLSNSSNVNTELNIQKSILKKCISSNETEFEKNLLNSSKFDGKLINQNLNIPPSSSHVLRPLPSLLSNVCQPFPCLPVTCSSIETSVKFDSIPSLPTK